MQLYLIFSCFLCGVYLLLMCRYRYGFKKELPFELQHYVSTEMPHFSIIIPARNEAQNIALCLQSILNNNYPEHLFEIIVIDDESVDDTYNIAKKILNNQHKVLKLQDFFLAGEVTNSYKKKALELAISNARGNYIITTDADCIVPPHWLEAYAKKIGTSHAAFIAAPVSFVPYAGRKTLLYYFQSIDFMTMQGITVASNNLHLGNMCNGANLCFSKSIFQNVEGYKGIDHKASGDDMMLMQKIAMRYPDAIQYLFTKDAIVETPVQPDFHSFLNQRIRWASKADSYPQKRMTVILAIVYFFNANFLILGLLGFIHTIFWKYVILFLIIKIITECYFLFPVSTFFNKRKELQFFVILQPLHILYIIAAGFLGKFGKYDWKNRKVQ